MRGDSMEEPWECVVAGVCLALVGGDNASKNGAL